MDPEYNQQELESLLYRIDSALKRTLVKANIPRNQQVDVTVNSAEFSFSSSYCWVEPPGKYVICENTEARLFKSVVSASDEEVK